MRTIITIALLSFALVAAAQAQVWLMSPSGGGGVSKSGVTPPVSNALLLEDGSSILLLEDGTSSFCLEGGC